MKKSTKLITTAVAMVLVLGVMVVGILAATSASAAISANVSWTATEGINFEIVPQIAYSKAHFESTDYSNGKLQMLTPIRVDTTTTNDAATGLERGFGNIEFYDDTPDDGVNNPHEIYLIYYFRNHSGTYSGEEDTVYGGTNVNVEITNYPQSNDNIEVGYFWAGNMEFDSFYPSQLTQIPVNESYTAVPTTNTIYPYEGLARAPQVLVMRLTVLTPDITISGFNADVSLSLTKA